MSERKLSLLDQLLVSANQALQTLHAQQHDAQRPNPAATLGSQETEDLDAAQRRHVAGLMRVNHAGEVCAQALYEGQALTARSSQVRNTMKQAAEEEVDHLAWCEERLQQLDAHPTIFNPLWYGLSFGIGAAAGLAGDRWSLGFVAETERQVCKHLDHHLQQIPDQDQTSRAIIEQMREDESGHAETAVQAGASDLPAPVRHAMTLVSKVMTRASYHR